MDHELRLFFCLLFLRLIMNLHNQLCCSLMHFPTIYSPCQTEEMTVQNVSIPVFFHKWFNSLYLIFANEQRLILRHQALVSIFIQRAPHSCLPVVPPFFHTSSNVQKLQLYFQTVFIFQDRSVLVSVRGCCVCKKKKKKNQSQVEMLSITSQLHPSSSVPCLLQWLTAHWKCSGAIPVSLFNVF